MNLRGLVIFVLLIFSCVSGFCQNRDQELTDVKVIKGVHPLLEKEAVRVIKAAPQKWACGYNYKGDPIDVHMIFSVIFKL